MDDNTATNAGAEPALRMKGMKILHVCAWAEALWHFKRPLLGRHRNLFGHMQIYCPPRQYGVDNPAHGGVDSHIQRLMDEGYDIKVGPIGAKPGLGTISQTFKLFSYLRANKFDVVFTHQPMGSLVGITAAFFACVPVKIYSTGGLKYVPGSRGVINFLINFVESILIRMSDATLLVNREDLDYLQRDESVREKAIYVGPNGGCGLDDNKFNPQRRVEHRALARKELKISDDVLVVGYAGRCVWEKGLRELIDAAGTLIKISPEIKVKFIIMGTGIHLGEIKAHVNKLGLSGYFNFPGYKYESDYYMSAFDMFVLPSFREGLPVALLEAMAMDIPSIATDIRGCRELIENYETGLLVQPENHLQLAEALQYYFKDLDRARELGKKGGVHVRREYSGEVLLGNTVKIVNSVIYKKTVEQARQDLS